MAAARDSRAIGEEMEWKKSTERALLNTEHILRSLSRKDRWKEPIAPIGRDATASVDERGTRAASPPVAEPSQALRQEVFTRDVEKRIVEEMERRLEGMRQAFETSSEASRTAHAGLEEELGALRAAHADERERRQRAERELAGAQRGQEETREAVAALRRRVEEMEEERAADRREARKEQERREKEAAAAAEELRRGLGAELRQRLPVDDAMARAQLEATAERIARLEADRGAVREEVLGVARAAKADARSEAVGAVEGLVSALGERLRVEVERALDTRLAGLPEKGEMHEVQGALERVQAHAADAQAGVARVGEVLAAVRARSEAADARATQETAEVQRLHARLREVVQVIGAMSARLSGRSAVSPGTQGQGAVLSAASPPATAAESSMVDAKVASLHAEFDRRFRDISAAMRDISAAVRPGRSRELSPAAAAATGDAVGAAPAQQGAIYVGAQPAAPTFDTLASGGSRT